MKVIEFIRRLFSTTTRSLSSGASIPFSIAGLWVDSHGQRVLFGATAIGCVLISAYLVWREEHDAHEALKKQNEGPRFTTDIETIFFEIAKLHTRDHH